MENSDRRIEIGKAKKPRTLEKTRQKNILKYLNAVPQCLAESRTQTGYGKKGGADIFGCIAGQHFELEVKQPGEHLTKLQQEWLDRYAEAGAITGRVEDVESTRQVFRDHGRSI